MAIKHTSRYWPRDNSYKNTLGRNPLLQDVTKIRNGEQGNLVSVGKGGREPWERGWEKGMSIGNGKFKKMGTMERIGYEVATGSRVQVRFCFHFQLSCSPCSSLLPVLEHPPSLHCYNTQKIVFCTHKIIHLVLIIVDWPPLTSLPSVAMKGFHLGVPWWLLIQLPNPSQRKLQRIPQERSNPAPADCTTETRGLAMSRIWWR